MTPDAFWAAEMQNRRLQQEQQQYDQQALMSGISMIAGAYGQARDRKNTVAAMDKGVGLMSDIGAIEPDIRDKFMNLDEREKPFVFDLLRQSMFAPYAAGQSAGFQAKAWDEYKSKWPASGGSQSRNKYGYRYQGP